MKYPVVFRTLNNRNAEEMRERLRGAPDVPRAQRAMCADDIKDVRDIGESRCLIRYLDEEVEVDHSIDTVVNIIKSARDPRLTGMLS